MVALTEAQVRPLAEAQVRPLVVALVEPAVWRSSPTARKTAGTQPLLASPALGIPE